MKKTELNPILQKTVSKQQSFGVYHVAEEGWRHIPFIVPPQPPRKLEGAIPYKLLAEAMKVLSSLPSLAEMSDLDRIVNNLFIRREVVQSSRLEGTWSTIDHALTPSDLSDAGSGKDQHVAVRSYAKIIDKIVGEAMVKREKIYSIDLVREIHRRIVEHDPLSSGVPGKLRAPGEAGSLVTIGGLNRKEDSRYNPTPPQEVRRCLKEVVDWLGDEDLALQGDAGLGLSLPVRLAIGHAHFEAVHPFTDGNGRTGRTLWAIQMVCAGMAPLYLSGYVEVRKDVYVSALEAAQKKLNYVPMIEFVCHAIIESWAEHRKSQDAIAGMPGLWQRRGEFRKNSAAERALRLLIRCPIISSATLQKELNISGPASTNAINQLVEKKIIKKRHFENRRPLYAAEEVIQILARPFGSEIALALEKGQSILGC